MFTNIEFVEFLKKMVGQPYWYGTCVYKCTKSVLTSKTKQYPDHYKSSRTSRYQQDIANNKISADCVGLGKGFLWTNGGEGVIEAIGTSNTFKKGYGINGCPDKSANGMYSYAKNKKLRHGSIDTIPEIPGLAVHKDKHVGYYIGNGLVIEARGFNYGIVITKLKDRGWQAWYEFPGITYVTVEVEPQKPEVKPEPDYTKFPTLRKGAKNEYVIKLQEHLVALGYNLGTYGTKKNGVDGSYGSKTVAAVKSFQKSKGLTVDGICGQKTWRAIYS